jgi:multisubunit Na+/H+ antiporter MnhB subunit
MKIRSIKIMLAGILAVPLMTIGAGLLFPTSTFADATCDTSNLTIGAGSNCSSGTNVPQTLFGESGIFTTIVNIFLFVIGAIAVIMLIYGGIRYTISGGDSKNVTAAKDTILYAVVGIVVAILAYAIVNFVIGGLIHS